MVLWISLLLLVLAGIAAVALGDSGTIGGLDGGTIASGAALLAILVFLGSSLAGDYIGRLGKAVKDAAIWAGLALLLVLGYSFRDEVGIAYNRVSGELMPPGSALNVSQTPEGARAVRIRKHPNGHFVVRARVNAQQVTMLVDTGASTIVLTTQDARALGFDPSNLTYSIPVRTANGATTAAAIRLKTIAIGPIEFQGLDALVARDGALSESLLGMNFLKELRSYEVTGDFLTLRG